MAVNGHCPQICGSARVYACAHPFVAAAGYSALHVLEGKAEDIVADSMRMQRLALEVDSRLQLARQAERDFMLRIQETGVEDARTVYATEFAGRLGEAVRNVTWLQDMKRFDASGTEVSQSTLQLVELRESLESYSHNFSRLIDLVAHSRMSGEKFERVVGELMETTCV